MKKFVIYGLLISVIIDFFLSPYASSFPDGLSRYQIWFYGERKKHYLRAIPRLSVKIHKK